jgi:hypothetical protein
MAEELGKIEKPSAEAFQATRKLYFVPLIISAKTLPLEIAVKIDHYWDEVGEHLKSLESKLGQINRVYHELIPQGGEKGLKLLGELKMGSQIIVETFTQKGATLEATEDDETLAELMDWSRCLSLNLQSQTVFARIVQFYEEANKKRNAGITRQLDETLKANEAGILIMAEGHQLQFPADIQIFYVAPPSLDEIKRWLRDNEEKVAKEQTQNPPGPETAENPLNP